MTAESRCGNLCAQHAKRTNAGAHLLAEFRLLLACGRRYLGEEERSCINQLLSEDDLNWHRVLSAAHNHGLIPLLSWHLLNDFADALPESVTLELRKAFQQSVQESLLLASELVKVVRTLAAAGVRTLAYKGPTLALWLYGNIGLRQFCDIDVLIQRRDFSAARENLLRAGYDPLLSLSSAQERSYLAAACEMQFYSPNCQALVELQWQIVPRYFSIHFDLEQLFERSEKTELAGAEIETLSREDTALVLAVHGGKHAWSRLCWLCDFAELLRCREINWNVVREQAAQLGVQRLLAVAVGVANQLLDAPIPRGMENLTAKPRPASLIAELGGNVAQYQPTQAERGKQLFDDFVLQTKLRERWRDRARMVYRLAATPNLSEWSLLKLPAFLSPFYLVIRSFRLLRRALPAPLFLNRRE
jgi:hypothetical protein